MSQSKKFKICIFVLVAILSCFVVGCKKSKPVKDIYFNFSEGDQIVLFVGETLEMKDYVSIKPSNASNKKYTLKSFDKDVVRVANKSITAVAEGNAQIKVVSDDNKLKEDLITVVVKSSKTQLTTPRNFEYHPTSETITFDKVTYATSYTLRINNQEIDLGNSNMFSMANYNGDFYNERLEIDVRANSPTYTMALEDSEWSTPYRMYQAGVVEKVEIKNGVLTFEKESPLLNVNLYLGDKLVNENDDSTSFDLTQLNESYIGASTQVNIETVVGDDMKISGVNYFNSKKLSNPLYVLDVPIVSVNQTTLTWQNIAYAQGYYLIIDGVEIEPIENNYFNLADLDEFETLFNDYEEHTILIDPIINDFSKNVGKTIKQNPITVKKLADPTITCEGNNVVWTDDEKAQAYSFTLIGGGVEFSSSIAENLISLLEYDAGEYELTVQAVGGFKDQYGTYYISSNETSKVFTKYEAVSAEIENYILKLSDLGETTCFIEFENEELNTTKTGNGAELDLSKLNFEPGKRTITLTRQGSVDSVLSKAITIEFVQLEATTDFRIEDGLVKYSNNNNASNVELIMETCKDGDVVYSLEDENIYGHRYNSVIPEADNYLIAGDYVAKIYVLGDGSSTFSVRDNNGDVVACETFEFTVLDVPELSLKSTSETILNIQGNENTTAYQIYNVEIPVEEPDPEEGEGEEGVEPLNDEEPEITLIGRTETGEYEFELNEGTVKYMVQSIGDGSRYLNSVVGATIQVARLVSPVLTYSNSTETMAIEDSNEEGTVDGYEFKVGDVVEDFDPSRHFDDDVELTLTALAVVEKDGIFYLNSQPATLSLTKIKNTAAISVNDDYNIEIVPEHNVGQYQLEVVFTFIDGSTAKFTPKEGENGILVEEEGSKELEYSCADNTYTLNIIKDYEPLFKTKMESEFSVEVRFLYPEGDSQYINSEFSEKQALNLSPITSETEFSIDDKNQLVITPKNHANQYGLVLTITNIEKGESLIFVSNGTKLIENNRTAELNFNYSNGAYCVKLMDESYNNLNSLFDTDFTVKVQYTLNPDYSNSFLNSEESEIATVHTLASASLVRDGQNIRIMQANYEYNHNNYALIINNKHLLTLTADDVTPGTGYLQINHNFIYSTLAPKLQPVNTVAVITLNVNNSATNLEICEKSAEIEIQKAETISLAYRKDNGGLDNSAVVEFETNPSTDYNKRYVVTFYDGEEDILTIEYADSDAEEGLISIEIDKLINESDKIDVFKDLDSFGVDLYVRVLPGAEGSDIVFDSDKSSKLTITKVATPTGLRVSESVLYFDEVENVAGYEIYIKEKDGVSYTLYGDGLITTNSLLLEDITETTEIVVKAISKTNNLTNSNYSDSITLKPTTNIDVKVENGEFKITLNYGFLFANMSKATITAEIKDDNGQVKDVDINIDDVDLSQILTGVVDIIVDPHGIMKANTVSLQPEHFNYRINVAYPEDTAETSFYLNSEWGEITAYALIAPSNVVRTTDDNATVETIGWTPSDKNKIDGTDVEVGYDFKVEYTLPGEESPTTYYSYDPNLKYYNATTKTYDSYSTIIAFEEGTNPSVQFPAGYDTDNNGELEVEFKAGHYSVSVRTMPLNNEYNLCYSKYSAAHEFEILDKTRIAATNDGTIIWNEQDYAKYKLEVYTDLSDEAETFMVDEITTNIYDFTNSAFDNVVGVLKVVITAVSTDKNVLNGESSDPIYLYRLPKATNVHVDDGQLIITANKYFSKALIEFVDKDGKRINQIEYTNMMAETFPVTSWKDLTSSNDIKDLTQMFVINLDEEITSLPTGRGLTINVTLVGRASDEFGEMGLITSAKANCVAGIETTKMNANVTEVQYGEFEFMPNENYATVVKSENTEEVKYTSLIDLNYVFGGTKLENNFWHNTAVYRINISKYGESINIYAVDYYSFIYAIQEERSWLAESVDYEILDISNGLYAIVKYNDVVFNVYKYNKINLKENNNISYYETTQEIVDGVCVWTSTKETSLDLATGGSFAITVTMLGGDSVSSTVQGLTTAVGHLNSAHNKLRTFIRYGVNNLATIDGVVEFKDMMPVEDGTVLDNPVYKVVVTPYNTVGEDKIFYLHTTEAATAQEVTMKHDPDNYMDATYVLVERKAEYEESIFFDLSAYITSGTYKVTIMTLAGLGVEGDDQSVHYLLNAKVPDTSYTFYKLRDVTFRVEYGVLAFDQSAIAIDSNISYANLYEITINDSEGNEHVYTINTDELTDEIDLDEVEHVVKYRMPAQFNLGESILSVVAGYQYNVKIRAISNGNYVLNGTYAKDNAGEEDVVLTFEKSPGVENLRVEEGMLKWNVLDEENYTNTIIKITFTDAYSLPIYIEIAVGDLNKVEVGGRNEYYYEFTSDKFNGYKIQSGVDYTISAYTKGNSSVLDSNPTSDITTTRLETVNKESIKTSNGILVWDEVQDAVKYELRINGELHESETNSFDVSGLNLPAGSYSINIRSIGSNRITSMWLDNAAEGFIQLAEVDTSTVEIGGNVITWEAVENAKRYHIVFNYSDVSIEEYVTTNSFTIEATGISGDFTIYLTAVGDDEDKIFNSKQVEFRCSTDIPNKVDDFYFDEDNSRLVIVTNSHSFVNSDSLSIVYNLEKYTESGKETRTTITNKISYEQSGRYEIVDETTTKYFLPLTVMGVYSNISVQVDRPNTLSSEKTQTDNIDFNLFSYGAGTFANETTEAEPYVIKNAEQLLNISYFPSANFVLKSAISFAELDITEKLLNGESLIVDNFTGCLDGENFAIYGFNLGTNKIELTNKYNFALFKSLEGATIKNLNIGGEGSEVTLTNAFTTASDKDITLALLATQATNSTIENIIVPNFKLQVNESPTKKRGKVLVAGLIANAVETTITSVTGNFVIDYDAKFDSKTNVYVGGLVAQADKTNVENAIITIEVKTNSHNTLEYVGGIIAHAAGRTTKLDGVRNSNVEITMSNVKVLTAGAIVGFSRYMTIDNCVTTGTYVQNGINTNVNIGGVVGNAQATTIQNSGSFIEFTLTADNKDNKFIGAIVGKIANYQAVNSEISGCYSNVYVQDEPQTTMLGQNVNVRMYGSAEEVDVTNIYYKEK